MRRGFMWLKATAAVALAMAHSAEAAPIAVDGDPVLYWAEQMVSSQGPNRLADSRSIAILSVALHDAVSASMGHVNHEFTQGLATQRGDTRAAAAQAAHDVLTALYPAKAAQYAAARTEQLALIPDGAAKTKGLATGATVAAAVLALRAGDGSTAIQPYTPTGEVGHWAPTGPAFAPFAGTQWGAVTPWLMDSGDAFRPVPPPALDSAEYAASFNEVKELGSATSATRTADQTAAAQFWATSPGNPMLRLAIQLAEGNSLSTIENARLLGILATSIADAGIATWDAKLHYDFWRPETAIQQADLDGNDATVADPNWAPLIANPPYPGYTSGLAGIMGSGALVLAELFGDETNICLTHGTNPALDRCWADFDALLAEMAANRIWAGIHFDFDMTAAFELSGAVVANVFASDVFDPVPEPAMFGLFGLGAGALLAAARRRRGRDRARDTA